MNGSPSYQPEYLAQRKIVPLASFPEILLTEESFSKKEKESTEPLSLFLARLQDQGFIFDDLNPTPLQYQIMKSVTNGRREYYPPERLSRERDPDQDENAYRVWQFRNNWMHS